MKDIWYGNNLLPLATEWENIAVLDIYIYIVIIIGNNSISLYNYC